MVQASDVMTQKKSPQTDNEILVMRRNYEVNYSSFSFFGEGFSVIDCGTPMMAAACAGGTCPMAFALSEGSAEGTRFVGAGARRLEGTGEEVPET